MMKPHIKFGILTGLASGIIFIATTLVGPERSGLLFFLYIFFLSFGLFFALKETREQTGLMSYGKGLGTGMITLLIAGTVDGLMTYPYCKFIHHSYMAFARNFQIDFFEQIMHPDSKQMADFKSNINWTVSPGSLALAELFRELFFGFFICLLVASLLKKTDTHQNKQEF